MISSTPKEKPFTSSNSIKYESGIQESQFSEKDIIVSGGTTTPPIGANYASEIISENFGEDFDTNNNTDDNINGTKNVSLCNNDESNNAFAGADFSPNHPSNRTYGLRPRTELRKPSYDCDFEEKEPPIEIVRRPRGQNRGSLMSKYRRRTANARERHRMREINAAFSTLRGILPPLNNRKSSQVSMTKIRTLRLAASYIQALSDLLQETDAGRMKPDLSTLNSSISLQHYSESYLLHKIQVAKTNSTNNFHASCGHKAKRQRSKNSLKKEGGGEDGTRTVVGNLASDGMRMNEDPTSKIFRLDYRIPLTPDPTSMAESQRDPLARNSWDVARPTQCDRDFISLLEDDSTQSSDIDSSLSSLVDYKALEDLYFALH